MKQIITWLGKPVKLISSAGKPLPRRGGTRGRFWLFTILGDGSRDDIDGFAQEKDLFITVVTCPTETKQQDGTPHTIIGCGSSNVEGPDDEGIYDCLDCGVWFDPKQERKESTDVIPE